MNFVTLLSAFFSDWMYTLWKIFISPTIIMLHILFKIHNLHNHMHISACSSRYSFIHSIFNDSYFFKIWSYWPLLQVERVIVYSQWSARIPCFSSVIITTTLYSLIAGVQLRVFLYKYVSVSGGFICLNHISFVVHE